MRPRPRSIRRTRVRSLSVMPESIYYIAMVLVDFIRSFLFLFYHIHGPTVFHIALCKHRTRVPPFLSLYIWVHCIPIYNTVYNILYLYRCSSVSLSIRIYMYGDRWNAGRALLYTSLNSFAVQETVITSRTLGAVTVKYTCIRIYLALCTVKGIGKYY